MYVGVDFVAFFSSSSFQISKKHVSVSYKKGFFGEKKRTRISYLFKTFLQSVGEDPRDNNMFIDLYSMTCQPQRAYAFSYEHDNS